MSEEMKEALQTNETAEAEKAEPEAAETMADYEEHFDDANPWNRVKEYMDNMVKEAHETGKVRTMFGRMRELPDINGRNFNRRSFAERTAMNTPIQGTAADIIKLAMNKVESILEEKTFKSRLLLQVHDELVLEVVNEELDAIQTLLKETMESIVELHVPLIVDVHNAENWALVK